MNVGKKRDLKALVNQLQNDDKGMLTIPNRTLAGMSGGAATKARGDVQAPATRFTRASMEHDEPAVDESFTAAEFGAGPVNLSFEVPAFGYLRDLVLLVEATSGAAGLATVAAEPDAPFSAIRSITFKDVNGGFVYGPYSGFQFMLSNKWGGYGYDDNPENDPNYSAVDTAGDFAFVLRIPLETIARDALGSLPNLNSASQYRVEIVVADDADVYATPPDTLPGIRIRGYMENWSKPSAQDPRGNPQNTTPPFERTTQFWSVSEKAFGGSGTQRVRLDRVGNFIRNIGFVFRDSGGDREGDTFPSSLKLTLDGQLLHDELTVLRRSKMQRRYGYSLASIDTQDFDEAVVWYDFTHDFDGKPGGELRDLWLPTVQSTRLELEFNAGEAGTLEILTNDVAIAAQEVAA